jgi:hypothetical protein
MVPVRAGGAAGWGRRATARVCAVAPTTVRPWLVEAAEPRRALGASFLGHGHVRQRQLDAWSAGWRGVKRGERSEDEALQRLERSPAWGGTARAPERPWRLVSDVGTRPREMAQGVGQRWGRWWRQTGSPWV